MRGRKITLIGWYLLFVAFVALSLLSLTGCKTIQSTETNTDSHKISQLVDRMDSIFRSTATWQRDIYSKQSSLIDSIREKEKSNSSHSVVLNEKGDTVRETIIIERFIERERSTENKESETIAHLQSQVDSLLRLSVENKALTDSLLKDHSKETLIEKKPTWWQRIKESLGGYAIFFIFIGLICLGIKLIAKRQKGLQEN